MNFDPMAGYEVKSRHCMIDLETVDNKPTSAIASIGAVMFDEDGIYEDFYAIVDYTTGLELGLTMSQDTMDWWAKQSAEARSIFDPEIKKFDTVTALVEFKAWFKNHGGLCVYGNGADFDNAIMATAYGLAGIELPWKYSNNRCFRTLKHKGRIIVRSGTYHNARDDARTQAQYLIDHGLVQPI